MKTTRINETMTSNKEMKLLIEGFNKFLNETVESREFDGITTGEVEFNWGSYSSSMKDEKYFIKSDEDALGEIQQNGDPFTYKEEDGNVIVVSAPESKKQSIGETIDSSSDNTASEESAPQINLTAGINFDHLKTLYEAYDSAVEDSKEDLNTEVLTTVNGRETLMSLYDGAKRRSGTRAPLMESQFIEKLPEDIKTAHSEVNNYENICRDVIAENHQMLDEFVLEVDQWARDQSSENWAELAFNALRGPIRVFLEAIQGHPLVQEAPENELGGRVRHLWNLHNRQDVSISAATAIAFLDFDESSSEQNILSMTDPKKQQELSLPNPDNLPF